MVLRHQASKRLARYIYVALVKVLLSLCYPLAILLIICFISRQQIEINLSRNPLWDGLTTTHWYVRSFLSFLLSYLSISNSISTIIFALSQISFASNLFLFSTLIFSRRPHEYFARGRKYSKRPESFRCN